MSKRILPLFDRILVQRVKAAERTASGLYIPENAQETLNEGLVIEVGQGLRAKDGSFVKLSIVKGDHVLLPPFGGAAVKLGDQELHLFKERSELV